MSDRDWNEEMLSHAEVIVEYGKENNFPLDYTLNSIRIADAIAGRFAPEKPKGLLGKLLKKEEKIDDALIDGICLRVGAYVGEVIRRQKQGVWEWNEQFDTIALRIGEQWWFPVAKVHKRIINGEEDNLYTFATVAINDGFNK